ncbi:hypothetical protein [Colwellia sp. Bg11-28]|uniref:hypothetical protein n=1 Tax=Colwellia sp. Bg11-28 TaxID=2058305 RepID=UPI000C343909|nr:hypothetical protein [Colwellia sp. Bg11-28]PKH88368.1 hypothetical protein CXF79_06310 [Colwellia sp. Bg11-28]
MSNVNNNVAFYLKDNPHISFDSKGSGVSRVYDQFWDFTAQKENTKLVHFMAIPAQHRSNVQSYTYALLNYKKISNNANHVAVSQIERWVTVLHRLCKAWGQSNFELLSNGKEWRDVTDGLRGKYSKATLSITANTVNALYEAGLVDRYVEHKDFNNLASEWEEKQHIALPPSIHAQLLERVIKTIDTYYPQRYDISNAMTHAIKLRDNYRSSELIRLGVDRFSEHEERLFGKRFRRRAKKISHTITNFEVKLSGKWVNNILIDCLIAVGLFSGARKSELLSMNSFSYQLIKGVPVLQGKTSKGNEGVPITASWVSHPLAKKALELAFDMTQYARDIHGITLVSALDNNLLTQDKYQVSLKVLESSFISVDMRLRTYNKVLQNYNISSDKGLTLASVNLVVEEEDIREFNLLNPSWDNQLKVGGKLPKLSLHDLRRSFAVFMVRNKLGNLQTLKYQYKHKNINMSGWYANYAEVAQMEGILMDESLFFMVENELQELAIDAFDDIYNQSITLSGGAGELIKSEKEDALARGEKIIMSRDEISTLVKNNSLSIVILPTGGYCTNTDCERLCAIESFVAESKPCDHQVITQKMAKIMAKQRNRLIKAFRDIKRMDDIVYTRILAGYKEKILYIENTLKLHQVEFEQFRDKVEVLHD